MKLKPLSAPGWLNRYREELIDLAALAAAVALARLAGFGSSWLIPAVAAGLLLLVPHGATVQAVSLGRRIAQRLPLQFGALVLAAAVNRFFLSQPARALAGLALWIVFAAVLRVGAALRLKAPVYRPRVEAGWRAAVARGADSAVLGALWLAGGIALCGGLHPQLGLAGWEPWVLGLLWGGLEALPRGRWQLAAHPRARAGRLVVRLLIWAALGTFVLVGGGSGVRAAAGSLVLTACAGLLFGGAVALSPRDAGRTAGLFLAGAFAFWLMRPLAYPLPLGAGDSSWYASTVADVVSQFRAGVFPVYVGQSEYQFNGSIFPVRFAPLLHHLSIVADLLSLQSLSFGAVLNLVLIGLGLGGACTAYFALLRVLPKSPFAAAMLSGLYVACPGVLGVLYNSDLYMTWTTVPVLPLALAGTIDTFQRRPGLRSVLLLVCAIGLLWWGHSPIALWVTVLLGGIQVLRLWIQRRSPRAWAGAVGAAFLFGVLVAYPLVSVLVVTPEKTGDNTSYAVADPKAIAQFVREAFPGSVQPVSPKGRASLSDLQLGWTLWAGLLLAAAATVRHRRPERVCFALAALFLLVLMLPIPGGNLWLWSHIPGAVRNPTGNWAMGRLYLIAAVLSVWTVALALSGRRPRGWLLAVLAGGLVWSGLEAGKFLRGTEANRLLADAKPSPIALENLSLTRYSYLSFKLPPYYSHGVVDPAMEQRLIRPDGTVLAGNYDALAAATLPEGARLEGQGELTGARGAAPGSWALSPRFRVEPGKRYALELGFLSPTTAGVLVIESKATLRVYGLPVYGEPRSFGAGAGALHTLSFFTSSGEAQEVGITYFPDAAVASQRFDRFGSYRWIEYSPSALPVRVTRWAPYEARVTAPEACELETPRLFQRGYAAEVDGKPAAVRKSPGGLVAVAVPRGESRVRLEYRAPWLLAGSYWLSVLGFAGLLAWRLALAWRESGAAKPAA